MDLVQSLLRVQSLPQGEAGQTQARGKPRPLLRPCTLLGGMRGDRCELDPGPKLAKQLTEKCPWLKTATGTNFGTRCMEGGPGHP